MALHHAYKHGHRPRSGQSKTYTSWNMMMSRCYRPSSPSFKDYGARGIAVCDRWHDFANFLADMGDRPEGRTIDRIDFNLGYSKENCRWATRLEQNRHKRNVRRIAFGGHEMTLAEWAERLGVKRSTLAQRLYTYGWPIHEVLKENALCVH